MCFNLLVRVAWILVILLGLATPSFSQDTAETPLDKHPYLLRISRSTPHLDTCVLLKRDGNYHLERDHDEATEVSEGELAADELSKLQRWLDNEQLKKITNDQIVTPLVIISVESLQIDVFRGDHLQELLFPSIESQSPFHESLAPLLEWFDELHKFPHRAIPEDSGKNNCLTPGKIELRTRPALSARAGQPTSPADGVAQANTDVQGPQAPASPSYLMRLEYTRFEQREAQRTCAVVYADGRYHLEKSSQQMNEPVKAHIYEASLQATELQGLQKLLDDPLLKELKHGNVPDNSLFAATDITHVWIPRDMEVQEMEFASDLRVQAAIGGHYIVNDKNTRLVRPLQKWVNTELRADKVNLIKGAVANACAPK